MNSQTESANRQLVPDLRCKMDDELPIVLGRCEIFADRKGALARSAPCNGVKPDLRAADIGFRVACDAK